MIPKINMLNPSLEPDSLRQDFSQNGRVRVMDILTPEYAEQAARWLETRIPWQVVFRRGKESATMTQQEFQQLTDQQRSELLANIINQAGERFQYLYGYYNLADAYKELQDPSAFLFKLTEFIASEYFRDFVRTVSGVQEISGINAQATRYVSGQFLTRHDDAEDPVRKVAYVLGLTRAWRPEWGGILQVLDETGNLVDSYVPRFNSLVLFKVPMWHCVSYVAPFAQAPRHSITGWFTT